MFLQTPDCHCAQWARIFILHSLLHNISFCFVLFPLGIMFARSISMYTGSVASDGCTGHMACRFHLPPAPAQGSPMICLLSLQP